MHGTLPFKVLKITWRMIPDKQITKPPNFNQSISSSPNSVAINIVHISCIGKT